MLDFWVDIDGRFLKYRLMHDPRTRRRGFDVFGRIVSRNHGDGNFPDFSDAVDRRRIVFGELCLRCSNKANNYLDGKRCGRQRDQVLFQFDDRGMHDQLVQWAGCFRRCRNLHDHRIDHSWWWILFSNFRFYQLHHHGIVQDLDPLG